MKETKIIPSEAVLEFLYDNAVAMRKSYAEAHRTALIAQDATVRETIEHWNAVSKKFQEKGDIIKRCGEQVAEAHGIDYMKFAEGVA